MSKGVYTQFFRGKGGPLFSWGIPHMADQAKAFGPVDVFNYTDVAAAERNLRPMRAFGYKIALVGYSLGNTTTTYLQTLYPVDLLLAIAESTLGQNHPINKKHTKRAVLWYGPGILSSAGTHDGFDETYYIDAMHLWMDVSPTVANGVRAELAKL
jgi:hypothetical protein